MLDNIAFDRFPGSSDSNLMALRFVSPSDY